MSKAFDQSDFDNQLDRLERLEPKMIERILLNTANQVKIDADEIPPKTPHLEGQLRGNVVVEMLKKAIVRIWYMMPYAARWHEAVDNIDPVTGRKINWSETGVGPKYIENKFMRFAEKYGQLMAELHKAELENA